MRRRKWISLPLCLCLAAALCGCGGRAAAPEAPAPAGEAAPAAAQEADPETAGAGPAAAPGEETAEEGAFVPPPAAEEAPPLPATRQEALAGLAGEWLDFCALFVEDREETRTLAVPDEQGVVWAGELPAALPDGCAVYYDEGLPLLVERGADGSDRIWVRRADYALYRDRHFVAVDVNTDNYEQFIGDFVRVGGYRDAGGYMSGFRMDSYMFRSRAYESGLVYFGCRDFHLQASYRGPSGTQSYYIVEPYLVLADEAGMRVSSVEYAGGTLFFVRADYVLENRVSEDSADDRVLILRDGAQRVFHNGWSGTTDGDYEDFLY